MGCFELRQEFHVYVGREHISLLPSDASLPTPDDKHATTPWLQPRSGDLSIVNQVREDVGRVHFVPLDSGDKRLPLRGPSAAPSCVLSRGHRYAVIPRSRCRTLAR